MHGPNWCDWQGLDCGVTRKLSCQPTLMGQIMFFGAKPAGKLQLCRDPREFSQQSFWQESPLWGAGFSMLQGATVLYQHRPAWVWWETAQSSAPRGAGRQEAAALPPLHPDISPGFLQSPWKRCCRALLVSFLSQEAQEEMFFPQQVLTGLAWTCPREIWQKCPPASYDWETGSVSLAPLRHRPPGLLLTRSVSAHIGGLILRRLLCTLMHSPASAFQPPGPKPKGTDLVLLSLSYFNRDRPRLALILRAETRSGAGTKLTPARWAQPQEPSPSIKI